MKAEGLLDEDRHEGLRERLIAAQLGLGLREADEVRRRLVEVDLILENWIPKGWSKYQYESDKSTDRVRRHREKKQEDSSVERFSNVSVTAPDTDTDTDTDKKKKKHCAPRAAHADGFARFWEAYPRKENKKKALEAWKRKGLEARADELIADVKARKARHRPWLDGVIVHATTYINGQRWEDAIDEKPNGTARGAVFEQPHERRARELDEHIAAVEGRARVEADEGDLRGQVFEGVWERAE